MGRPQSGCARCGGQSRRRSAQNLVAVCADCMGQVCTKHVTWCTKIDAWVCTACDRKREK